MEESDSVGDLADSLSLSFAITKNPYDANRPHPRFSQYKMKNSQGPASQEVRRQRTLEIQKKRRDDFMAVARALADGNIQDEDSDVADIDIDDVDWMDDTDQSNEPAEARNPSRVEKLLDMLKLRKSFKNQLMQSEWLSEVPKKLSEEWVALPVPEGKRNLVIAGRGMTKQFSRSGAFVNQFPSFLPGGCRNAKGRGDVTILDTIYSPKTRTFYIVDCMVWNGFSYYDCDTEFRWFMVASKLAEKPELLISSRLNPYTFQKLPSHACSRESLIDIFHDNPSFVFDPVALDGILFYHKRVHYLPGVTPLVGWLKSFMLPEILNLPVAEKLLTNQPHNYSTMNTFISEYNAKSPKVSGESAKDSKCVKMNESV